MSRELDALVAEKVMGFTFWKEKRGEYELCLWERPGLMPWSRTQRGELQKHRYTQVTASESVKIGFFGTEPPKFTSDATTDYEVLKHVRENWPHNGTYRLFAAELDRIFAKRVDVPDDEGSAWSTLYEPGDYSRAALKVLGEVV